MKLSRRIAIGLAFLLTLTITGGAAYAYRLSEPFDHSKFDQFLQLVVNENGEVNFELAQQNVSILDDYIGHFSDRGFDRKDFYSHWPREERLAALLNIYHAALIKLILDYYPIKSVNDVPGFWSLASINIGKTDVVLSLNSIRQNQLIESFRDEKIHLALACAAKSCPGFPRHAFTGPEVEGQLYVAARDFVNNEKFNQIDLKKKKVFLSRIFKWYASDFKLDFGFKDEEQIFTDSENAVLSFIAYYTEDAEKIHFLEERQYKIKYLPFDWTLNQWYSESNEK